MILGVISDKFMRKTSAKHNVTGVKSGSERDESMVWENLCRKLADAGERLAAQDSELAKLKRENKHLHSIVSELSQKAQDNKVNEVAGGIVIPAMRYVKESPHKNFAKVQEEFIEAFDAYMVYLNHPCDETFEHLTEEATDIQMAVETFLASLGMTVEERRKAKDIVVLKNASRGYLEESKKKLVNRLQKCYNILCTSALASGFQPPSRWLLRGNCLGDFLHSPSFSLVLERVFVVVNNVNLLGRLVRDVELKYTQSGTAVAKFTTAVDRDNKKKLKEQGQPTADFIPCIAWGKTAELVGKYFSKGSQIGVTGRLQTGSYTKQDGTKVYTTDVVVDKITFVDRANGGMAGSGNGDGYVGDLEESIPF